MKFVSGKYYLVGIGTVFLFLGFYLLKAAFQKNTSPHGLDMKGSTKVLLICAGMLSIALGIYLVAKAISRI